MKKYKSLSELRALRDAMYAELAEQNRKDREKRKLNKKPPDRNPRGASEISSTGDG